MGRSYHLFLGVSGKVSEKKYYLKRCRKDELKFSWMNAMCLVLSMVTRWGRVSRRRVVFLKSLQNQNSSYSRIILTKDGGYFLLSANMAPPCGHSINSWAFPWLSLFETVISWRILTFGADLTLIQINVTPYYCFNVILFQSYIIQGHIK